MAKRRNARARGRKPKRRRFPWRFVLVLLLAAAATVAWLIWPFWQLAEQFGTHPTKQPSRLYGRPFELRTGAPASAASLSRRLEDAGYTPSPTATAGTFRTDGTAFEIARRRFSTAAGPAGGDRLRVELRDGEIAAIARSGRSGGERLAAAFLDPPLVASYYGPDLKERRPIGLDELPEDLILAVLAAEDTVFLSHVGVSPKAILRAAWVNLWAQEVKQGGSTLTQQLVKNLYLTSERKLGRKLREAVLAVLIELRYPKREILQAYLNEIYWGRSGSVNLMGVGAAAWAYFGKHPTELTLADSALLAGMIQSPSNLSPLADPDAARRRRDVVLARLVQLKWVTQARAESASREPLTPRPALIARRAPYFAAAVEGEAARRFGVASLNDAGYVLHSTLDLGDQRAAEEALVWGVEALEKGWEKDRKGSAPLQAALISVDPTTGGILAYVGGRDFGGSQFDRVTQARRQAGSAFKPIVYAAAFEPGDVAPATLLDDAPYTVKLASGPWSPQNSDGRYRGQVTARAALEESLNVPTARLAGRVGVDRIITLARRLGVESRLEPYPALALGAAAVRPIELAAVYSTLAAGGARPTLHRLVAVFDRAGQTVAGAPISPPVQVLGEDVAYLVTDVLRGVLDRGTAKSVRAQGLTDTLAGKTGTTNSRRDSWFAGYSPERATLVWVGYDDNRKTRLSGTRAALPIWGRFTYKVRPADGYTVHAPTAGVVAPRIDPATVGLATDRCPAVVTEVFLRSDAPAALCPLHSGFRATPLEQPEGVEVEDKQHPFKRFLRIIRGKKSGS